LYDAPLHIYNTFYTNKLRACCVIRTVNYDAFATVLADTT